MNPLYMTDSYLKEFETTITEVNKEKFIVLDNTAFYPTSGGQPNDTGIIVKDGQEFNVVYCGKFSGQISHEVDKEGLQVGDKVKCTLDWNRRYKLMRMHTAAHILSQVLFRDTKALITGNQLNEDKSRIDFSLEDYNRDKIDEYIGYANKIIEQDLLVNIEIKSREEAMKLPSVTRLAKGLPESLKELRIVSIGDFDIQADGGTHVKSTKEIGKISLLKVDNKGKNNRRLYFAL